MCTTCCADNTGQANVSVWRTSVVDCDKSGQFSSLHTQGSYGSHLQFLARSWEGNNSVCQRS